MYGHILYCYSVDSVKEEHLSCSACGAWGGFLVPRQHRAVLHLLIALKMAFICVCRKPGFALSQMKIMAHLKEYRQVFIAAHQRIISVGIYHIYSAED